MTKDVLTYKLHFLCLLLITSSALAQSTSSSSSSTPTPVSASSGTYSIEAEILAYKSLQVNGNAIATDVAAGLPAAVENRRTVHLLIVPSASTILPAFQQWRANMAIVENFEDQYTQDKFDKDTCPVDQEHAHAPSFSAYTTAIGEGVAALQSILGLFANSQAVTEYPGTIQDQALITAVSRELKTKGFEILVPDVYTSWAVANVDIKKFPYLGKLADLIAKHGSLQQIYQCNTLVVSGGTQLQQAEITRETDYSTLAAMDLTKPDAKPQPVLNDIASMKAQIDLLRGKIGIAPNDAAVQRAENIILNNGRILADKSSSSQNKQDALQKIQAADASVGQKENSILLAASLRAAQAQSLVAGIESYLAGLTGGAVSLNSTAVAAAPVTATASAPVTGGTGATATTASPAVGSSSAPAVSVSASSSATPPILTILQMDGLARRMGLPTNAQTADCTGADDPEKGHCAVNWRILWLKAMESGGADIAEANIFGSHPHFGGGAVSGYALFSFDGTLNCSGNVAAYGGYFKAKDFTKHGSLAAGGSPPTVMLSIDGGCAVKAANPGGADQ
jgi:hypothetical protein